jgi:outer membrane protein TolC
VVRGRTILVALAALTSVPAAAQEPNSAAPAAPSPPAPAGSAGPAVRLTLEEAIRTAITNNPNLQATQEEQRRARARIGEARASTGPTVDATANYNRQGPIASFEFSEGPGQPTRRVQLGSPNTRTASIDATFRPDLSGRTSASVGIARAGAEAAEATTAATVNDLTQQVQSSYYGALRTQTLVEVRRQAVAAAQEQLRVAQAEFRAGTKPQFDVLRASVQVENLRQNQTVAETNARTAIANLVNLLGIEPTTQLQLTPVPVTPLPPPRTAPGTNGPAPAGGARAPEVPAPSQGPGQPANGAPAQAEAPQAPPPAAPTGPSSTPQQPLPADEAAAFAEAAANRPEVQRARETVRQNRAQVRFESRARRPELAITGGYQFTPDATGLAAEDRSWRIGAAVSLNLFDAGLIRSRVRQAQAGQEAAEAQLERAEQQVALEVRTALLNLREAEERRQTTAANVEQAQEALRIAQVRYRAGVGTNVEVTDAQVALIEAQTNQVNAEYDFLDAQAQLARALGRYAPPTAGSASPPPRAQRE